MNWRQAHQEAMYLAAEAHEEYAVDTLRRIDVFAVIAAAGIKLLFRPLGHAAGFYLPADVFGAPGIEINSDHPLALQRYSGGHELGHYEFGHRAKVDMETEVATRPEPDQLEPEEMLAEAFASWFLMPPELVDCLLEQLHIERLRSPGDAYQLALRLGTSYRATCYHLSNLKLMGSAKAHAWGQLELRKIKEQITTLPRPEGWHYDVWAICKGDVGKTLTLRPGDRVVVELANATNVIELPEGATILKSEQETLFPGMLIIEIDLARNAPEGRGAIELERDGAGSFRVEVAIEPPLLGVYPRDSESPREHIKEAC